MSNLHDFQTLLSAYNLLLSDLQSTAEYYRQQAIHYSYTDEPQSERIYLHLALLALNRMGEVEEAIRVLRQQIIELKAAIN